MPDDQDKAIAYTLAKSEVCELCGSRESDWIDPETGRILPKPPLVPTAIRCHGCTEKAAFREATYKESGIPDGVHIVLWNADDVDLEGKIISKQPKQSNDA